MQAQKSTLVALLVLDNLRFPQGHSAGGNPESNHLGVTKTQHNLSHIKYVGALYKQCKYQKKIQKFHSSMFYEASFSLPSSAIAECCFVLGPFSSAVISE